MSKAFILPPVIQKQNTTAIYSLENSLKKVYREFLN